MENLTKQQAIEAMKEGKKVTHNYFTSEEYMFMPSLRMNLYQFEDGVKISSIDFWEIIDSESYNTGWSIFNN